MVVQLYIYVDVGSTSGCGTAGQKPSVTFSYPAAYVTKQYNLVLAKTGGKQGLH